jgi:hypothetical protein
MPILMFVVKIKLQNYDQEVEEIRKLLSAPVQDTGDATKQWLAELNNDIA